MFAKGDALKKSTIQKIFQLNRMLPDKFKTSIGFQRLKFRHKLTLFACN